MKGILVLTLGVTIAAILWMSWRRHNPKQRIISVATLVWLGTLSYLGLITRPIPPLFLIHIVLVATGWVALLWYARRGVYMWWFFLAPLATIGLFLALEYMEGSRHEALRHIPEVLV